MSGPEPKLRDLFFEALQHPAADDQAAYLDQACAGKPELRERLESLLKAHREAGSFLCEPAPSEATIDLPPPIESPGTMIGPYKLLEQIGEGGFGVVFMAEQVEPIRRKLALKVLKPGMDTRQVVARFEAERQALAIMDHPNIAKVFDGGATPSGRPYFVMELVKGRPITEFCDQNQLTPRQRLELFVLVCQAVQHAHQKGIIHRDIKPNNVLVTMHDTTPVPKVIDFGVAKALGQELTDKTVFTGFAQMIGTPLYMSPEQAGQSGLDIDTRSDIYSLGVLLYELLTGMTPFSKERFNRAAYEEIRRIIREEEPSKPSTKLSTAEGLPTLAANRGTEPAKLTKLVRGELDWIVMKALEKDRNRRYETSNGFAMDVMRYLAGEAVQAVPPSTAYRLKKFVRRNKGPMLAVSLVLLILVAGVVGTTWGMVEARRRAAGERLARNDSDANFAVANESVETYLQAVTLDPDLKRADFNRLRKRLLEGALPFLERLTEQRGDDPATAARRGRAYLRLASLRWELAEHPAAIRDAEAAQAIFDRLAAEFPDEPAHRRDLAISHLLRGFSLVRLGRHGDAEAAQRQAIDIVEALPADVAATREIRELVAQAHNNLGYLLRLTDRFGPAAEEYRKALTIRQQLAAEFPNVPELENAVAESHNNLGNALEQLRRPADAEAAYGDAVTIQERLVARHPTVPHYRQYLAKHLYNLGSSLVRRREFEKAEAALRRGLALTERLATDYPTVPDYRQDVVGGHIDLGGVLEKRGKYDDAEAAFRRAVEVGEKLVVEVGNVPSYHRELAAAHAVLGHLLAFLGKHGPAAAALRRAVDVAEKLIAEFPSEQYYPGTLAANYHGLGFSLVQLGNGPAAEKAYTKAVALREKLAAKSPEDRKLAVELGAGFCNLGNLIQNDGRPEAALDFYQKAIAALQPVAAKWPQQPNARLFLCNSHSGRAGALEDLGRDAEATLDWEKALELADGTRRDKFRRNLALARLRGALRDKDSGRCLAAAAEFEAMKGTDAGWLFDAACIRGVCAAVIPKDPKTPPADVTRLAREQADLAMAWLQKAVAAGYRNAANMKKGLKPLQEREDFKKLLEELEAKKK